MARIQTYSIDTFVSDKDIIIGTDADNFNQTKNFTAETLRGYMLSGLDPETGGNLKITTITATDEVNLTPEDYFNNQDPAIEVLNYEIIFLILNGRTYIFRRNGDVFGSGETQTISTDFTEIDITSIINANLQDLDSVLTEGNESDLDIKVNELYLKNSDVLSGEGSIKITGYENRVNFYNNIGDNYAYLTKDSLSLNDVVNDFKFDIKKPTTITDNRVATFQDASGTVAYLSDIPTDYVSSVTTSGEGLSATINQGVLNINYTATTKPYLVKSQLIDLISNTTYFLNGGVFEYLEEISPINSILLEFSEDISVVFDSPLTVVRVFVFLENNTYQVFNFTKNQMTSQNQNSLLIPFPFSEIWSDVVGERVLSIDISVMPKSISNDEGILFDGCVPSSICKYVNVF